MRSRRLRIAIGTGSAACGAAACGGAGARDAVVQEVALVDSVPFHNELIGDAWLRRVAVRTAAGVDTLDGVLTDQRPVVAGDTLVLGLIYDQDRVAGAFEYAARDGALRLLDLPEGLYEYSTPRLSPDGRHLAFMARDSAGLGYAVVVSWPDGRVVYEGPKARLLESDGGVDRVSWRGADAFEVLIELSLAYSLATQRVRGTVGGSVTVDTLTGSGR